MSRPLQIGNMFSRVLKRVQQVGRRYSTQKTTTAEPPRQAPGSSILNIVISSTIPVVLILGYGSYRDYKEGRRNTILTAQRRVEQHRLQTEMTDTERQKIQQMLQEGIEEESEAGRFEGFGEAMANYYAARENSCKELDRMIVRILERYAKEEK